MKVWQSLIICTFVVSNAAPGLSHAQDDIQPALRLQPAQANSHAADQAAIRKVFEAFAKSFEDRNAASLAGYFTTGGEFQNVQGDTVQGREALQQAFSQFFEQTPEVKGQIQSESLRFLSADSAIDEGIATVQRGPAEPATRARYVALVIRDEGVWRIATMSESSLEPSIDELDWLIGQWKSTDPNGAEIQTTYSWTPGKKFIRMDFKLVEKELALSGTQIIGLDPATGLIHSWTFEADGGIGEADWLRDGDHWVLDAGGTLADGSSLTETNVLRRIDNDSFTWQSTGRMLNDAELADLPPTTVERVK